ncbi:MAG: hypothetical protein K8H88_12480 [Sandaracinaceae bacterium]|nr:hypothetical protein [Sandaracinaceae bacterium]
MPVVHLPKTAVSEFDMPRVCVTTGATEGVTFQKVTFTFVPLWARLSVAFCGLIGVILMLVSTKRVQAEIPFTDAAYSKWKMAKIIPALIIVGGIPLIFLPMLIDEDLAMVGLLAFIAAVIGAVVYAVTVTKAAGPFCKEITEDTLILEIPSDAAAEAMSKRLGAVSV